MSFIRCTRNQAFVITAKSGMPGLKDQAAWSADFNSAYIAGKSLTLWKPVKLPSQERAYPSHRTALGRVFKIPTEQLESISRRVPRKKRRNSGAYFEHFCGGHGVKAAEMRPSGF
jgi:hypothetical protein